MLFANNITRRSALQGAGALALAAMLPQGALAKSLVKAGEREVFSFSDGALTLPFSIAAGERKADEVLAVLKAGGMPTDRNIAPLNVTAIKDGDGYTFVDCGAGSRFLDGSGKLGDTIEAAGVDRAKVTRVIFTHAHPDHLWGAIDEMDEPLFPNATYFLSKVDRDFWLSSEQLDKAAEDRKQFFAGAQRIIKALGGKLQTFEPGKEIAPGMMALDTGGHTPGHVSLEVKLGSESLIVLGDALTHPLISFQHPDWQPGSDTDKDRAAATRRKLLDRIAGEKLRIIGYHLPNGGFGRAEKSASAYRFISA